MHSNRGLLTLSVLALSLSLGGCETMEDWFSTKKPLPGDRKAVFPTGVPGVPQGVPPELVQGYQPPAEPEPQVVQAPPERPKPKPRPQPQRPRQVAAPTQQPAVDEEPLQPTRQAPPRQAPRPAAAQPQQAQPSAQPSPWPEPRQTASQPAPAPAPNRSPFPDPPPPGTFAR